VAVKRAQLLQRLFPDSVPALWCPLITHYREGGSIDRSRTEAHLRHLAPHVSAFLIPGSTGDGWVLDPERNRQLIEMALNLAETLNLKLLLGVLRFDGKVALDSMLALAEGLRQRTGEKEPLEALAKAHVCGFTLCPPKGKAEPEIEEALTVALETGLPIALYQLPQITQNEISPELAARLAERFANFIFFKDTSGTDRVARSGKPLDGVFTVRGAEREYARWLEAAGGPYQGFLLSTANCFARELRQVIDDVAHRRAERAREISQKITSVTDEAFNLVRQVRAGNPFANANKAIDHFFAHGLGAAKMPPPLLYTGDRIPVEVLLGIERVLERHQLLPATGYLQSIQPSE
jgi:dihydrodipicolinate synthase/N-acetylneuraminate lyase